MDSIMNGLLTLSGNYGMDDIPHAVSIGNS